MKNEKLLNAQLKMEENSKVQVEKELEFIKVEIENNDELAIFYLKKYLEMLKSKK